MTRKGNAFPLQVMETQGGGDGILGFHFHFDIRHYLDGRDVSPTRRPHLTLQKIPWYSFLLEAEWTPELVNAHRRNMPPEHFRGPHRESIFPCCGAVVSCKCKNRTCYLLLWMWNWVCRVKRGTQAEGRIKINILNNCTRKSMDQIKFRMYRNEARNVCNAKMLSLVS